MLGAILLVHAGAGFFLPNGYEFVLALFAMALTLMVTGAGRYSADAVIAALILINALYVAAECSAVSARRSRLQQEKVSTRRCEWKCARCAAMAFMRRSWSAGRREMADGSARRGMNDEAAMVHVVAELTFAPEHRAAFLDAFAWLEPFVRAEDGCMEYRGALEVPTLIGAQTPPRGDVLMVIEKWRDEAALTAHLDAPHMGQFGERVGHMMPGRVIRISRDMRFVRATVA